MAQIYGNQLQENTFFFLYTYIPVDISDALTSKKSCLNTTIL